MSTTTPPEPRPARHRLRRLVAACLTPLLASLGALAVGVPAATAAVPAAVSTTFGPYGYPDWYQDTTGVRVQPCLYTNAVPSVADPNCILLADATFNPANPLTFPGPPLNFPGEYFYAVADSDKVTTPGCAAQGWPALAAGAFTRVALEGSFVTGTPVAGDQITFARIRIVVKPHGLCPNTTYAFTHPYGVELVTTKADGGVPANKSGFTEDIGCLAAPCDWTMALASRVLGGFVRWDPAVAPAAPAGYLGDGVTLHRITGSPNTLFRIADASNTTVLASTNLFAVSGKKAGLIPAPTSVDFGGQVRGTTSAARTITVTNADAAPVTFTGIGFTGTNSGDFRTATGTTCLRNGTLAANASCVVTVTFNPGNTGVRTGQLSLTYSGGFRSPLVVPLTGTGILNGNAPVASLSATSLAFPSTRVRTVSAVQTVTVSNTGTAPLTQTAPLALTGTGASQFVITADNCSTGSVAAGSSCAVSVRFDPTVAAASTATLTFTDNAAGSPRNVAISGTGTGGLAAVSTVANPPGIDANGFPTWYQDENAVQLQPCINVAEPCVLLADPGFNPALPMVFPTNFPVEFFYTVADTDKMNVPGCPAAGTGPAKVTYRVGLEGSFFSGVAQAGQQITFTRTRIVVGPGGLCPNKTYAFTTPYGTDLVTTDANGGVVANKKGATIDTGCGAVPCDFTIALTSRTMGGFLRWDPAVAPAAPAGFLGDASGAAGTPHPVVGAPFIDPVTNAPANFLRIADATTGATLTGCTDAVGAVIACLMRNFTVSGKLATPVTAATPAGTVRTPIDFGAQTVATTSATRTLTFTNTDPVNAVTMGAATFIGANPTDYTIPVGTNLCTGVVVAAGGTCTVGVAFTPLAAGPSSAALSVSHSGVNSPVQVPLSGTGLANAAAPTAGNDTAITPVKTAVTIAVLANDSDPGGSALTVVGVTQPVNGTAVVNADNTVTYTPNIAFSGTDTFTYQDRDALGFVSNVATVTIQVGGATTTTAIGAPTVISPANGVVTVTVASAAGTPTGTVSLTVDGGLPLTGTLVNGAATFTLTAPAVGVHNLVAAYSAQGAFAASSALGTLTVQTTTATSITAPAVTAPANGLVTVTVTSAAGIPTGNVSLRVDGGGAISQALVNGSTTFTLTSPAPGTHTLSATFAAQGTFAASSATGSLVVNGSGETITGTASAVRRQNLTAASWNVQGTTTVLAPHTMTVTLTRTGALIGTATTDNQGRWKVSVTNTVVPVLGDTVTVTSSLGAARTITVSVQ